MTEPLTIKIDLSRKASLFELTNIVYSVVNEASTVVLIRLYLVGSKVIEDNDWEQFFDYLIGTGYKFTIVYRGYLNFRMFSLLETFPVQISSQSKIIFNTSDVLYPLKTIKSPDIRNRYLQRLSSEYINLTDHAELDLQELYLLGFDNITKF